MAVANLPKKKVNDLVALYLHEKSEQKCLDFRLGWETATMFPAVRTLHHPGTYCERLGIDAN